MLGCTFTVRGTQELTAPRVDHADLLQNAEAFGSLDRVTLARLAAHLGPRQLADGELLCAEGDTGDALFIISRGRIGVFKAVPDGSTVQVATRGSGEVVGEMALLTGEPRSATLIWVCCDPGPRGRERALGRQTMTTGPRSRPGRKGQSCIRPKCALPFLARKGALPRLLVDGESHFMGAWIASAAVCTLGLNRVRR